MVGQQRPLPPRSWYFVHTRLHPLKKMTVPVPQRMPKRSLPKACSPPWDIKIANDDHQEEDASKECPVCLEPVEDVFNFPCGHYICRECYTNMRQYQFSRGNADVWSGNVTLHCPMCRRPVVTYADSATLLMFYTASAVVSLGCAFVFLNCDTTTTTIIDVDASHETVSKDVMRSVEQVFNHTHTATSNLSTCFKIC